MTEDINKLLFVDRFRPSFKGIELLVLRHVVDTILDDEAMSPEALAIIGDILKELNCVIDHHCITPLPDCISFKRRIF